MTSGPSVPICTAGDYTGMHKHEINTPTPTHAWNGAEASFMPE